MDFTIYRPQNLRYLLKKQHVSGSCTFGEAVHADATD